MLVDALRTIIETRPHHLPRPENVPVFQNISFQTLSETAEAMSFNRIASQYGAAMLHFGMNRHEGLDKGALDLDIALTLIAGGLFREACDILEAKAKAKVSFAVSLRYLFNFAMADWGLHGKFNEELFQRVRNRFELSDERDFVHADAPNLRQCMAVTFALLGQPERARAFLKEARSLINARLSSFSCWSYQPANRATFELHCQQIAKLIDGETVAPLFIVENRHTTLH